MGETPQTRIPPEPPPLWRRSLAYAGGALLGVLLLVAAYAKAIDPRAFEEQIGVEGLAIGLSAWRWALVAIAAETALGLALLLGLRRVPVLLAATALVALFLFLTGRTYWHAAHGIAPAAASCGCFGNLVDRSPAQAFWQDLLLLVPSLALAWTARPRTGRLFGGRALTAGAAGLAVALFARAAPGLPLDDLATRLAPGVSIQTLCAGRGSERICLSDLAPELARGTHWVVLADPRGAGFDAVGEALNRYALSRATPDVALLADLTPDERMAIFWRLAPAFALHEVPTALLRPLYRSLPRSFLLEEGKVVRTVSGFAPELHREAGTPAAATKEGP